MRQLCLLAISMTLAACDAGQPPLLATDVLISTPPPGLNTAAGYLALKNPGGRAIRITHVASPQLSSVAMHETTLTDGVARMRPLTELIIPAGDTVKFEPGAKHLMLEFPQPAPDAISLQFYSADTLLLSIDVRPKE